MSPLAMLLWNHHVLSLQHHLAIIDKHLLSAGTDVVELPKASEPNTVEPQSMNGTGVYFNNREVPQNMHVPCSSRANAGVPSLPIGKPMPQPPKLMSRMAPLSADNVCNSGRIEQTKSTNKRGQTPELRDERPSKRVRTTPQPDALSSEQKCFLEAALALSSVRNSTSPSFSPKNKKHGGLPPPPFSLSHSNDRQENATPRSPQCA